MNRKLRALNGPIKNVLFLCTGNSARSILAEGILNHIGHGKFKAYSAGSNPVGTVNPHAIQQLISQGITGDFTSKNWRKFERDGAPHFDLVITVCDKVEKIKCPAFHGPAYKLHWSLKDPAAVKGTPKEIEKAFATTCQELYTHIQELIKTL
tara:strand:+ start:31529 stop:31984 length:456 start_codon:yes stop_codon:yes gene_type:complete